MCRTKSSRWACRCAERDPVSTSTSAEKIAAHENHWAYCAAMEKGRGPGRFSCAPTLSYSLPLRKINHLGEWLVQRRLLNRAELFTALDVAFRYNCRLGDALVWLELFDRVYLEQEVRRYEAYRTSA